MELDLLAFGAHADDVEIGMSATIIKYRNQGFHVGICDLTEADLSSNGSVPLRRQEAQSAAERMGVETRINLGFPDRGLQYKDEYIREIVRVLRMYKPKIIFAPFLEDRHPDHAACALLVEEAMFSAGIRKFMPEIENHRVQSMYYYMINGFHKPSFCVDVSEEMDGKIYTLQAYESQFSKGTNGVATPLTDGYTESVIARDKLFGKEVGVKYAEGFMSKKPLLLNNDLLGGRY